MFFNSVSHGPHGSAFKLPLDKASGGLSGKRAAGYDLSSVGQYKYRTLGQNASYTMFYYQLLLPNLESSHLCNLVSLRQATRTAHFCGTNSCHYLLSHCSDSINISLNSGHRPPGTVELLLELSFPFLARALPPVHGSIVLLTPGWLCPCVPLPYIVTAPHTAGNWLTAREQLLHRGRSRRHSTSFTNH